MTPIDESKYTSATERAYCLYLDVLLKENETDFSLSRQADIDQLREAINQERKQPNLRREPEGYPKGKLIERVKFVFTAENRPLTSHQILHCLIMCESSAEDARKKEKLRKALSAALKQAVNKGLLKCSVQSGKKTYQLLPKAE